MKADVYSLTVFQALKHCHTLGPLIGMTVVISMLKITSSSVYTRVYHDAKPPSAVLSSLWRKVVNDFHLGPRFLLLQLILDSIPQGYLRSF